MEGIAGRMEFLEKRAAEGEASVHHDEDNEAGPAVPRRRSQRPPSGPRASASPSTA